MEQEVAGAFHEKWDGLDHPEPALPWPDSSPRMGNPSVMVGRITNSLEGQPGWNGFRRIGPAALRDQ